MVFLAVVWVIGARLVTALALVFFLTEMACGKQSLWEVRRDHPDGVVRSVSLKVDEPFGRAWNKHVEHDSLTHALLGTLSGTKTSKVLFLPSTCCACL